MYGAKQHGTSGVPVVLEICPSKEWIWVDTDGGGHMSSASIQDMSLAESEQYSGQILLSVHSCNHVCFSGVMSLLLDTSLGWTLKVGMAASQVAGGCPFAGTSFVCGLPDP